MAERLFIATGSLEAPNVLKALSCLIVLAGGMTCASAEEIVVEENVQYVNNIFLPLTLDIARPAGEGPYPAIVFIHGGGWRQGSRRSYREKIEEAAKRGYVAATISYRLLSWEGDEKAPTKINGNFPAQVNDCKSAIRWLRANAKKYHVNPDKIGVTGGSAGGHLSLMVGLTDAKDLEGKFENLDQSSKAQAVVNVFGPTEMVSSYEKSIAPYIFALFMGGPPERAADNYKAASPITYVTADDPPVLTIHGTNDALVPFDQATQLDEAMKKAGVSHTLLKLEGAGHGFFGDHAKQADEAMWEFFDKHLKGK